MRAEGRLYLYSKSAGTYVALVNDEPPSLERRAGCGGTGPSLICCKRTIYIGSPLKITGVLNNLTSHTVTSLCKQRVQDDRGARHMSHGWERPLLAELGTNKHITYNGFETVASPSMHSHTKLGSLLTRPSVLYKRLLLTACCPAAAGLGARPQLCQLHTISMVHI